MCLFIIIDKSSYIPIHGDLWAEKRCMIKSGSDY